MGVLSLFNQDALKAAQKLSVMQQKALDNSAASIMMVDNHGLVTYANQACYQSIANCGVTLVPGQHCDSLGQGMFGRLAQHTNGAAVSVGNKNLQLTVTPLTDPAGVAEGYILEWADNAQLNAQQGKLNAMRPAAVFITPISSQIAENEVSTSYC